MNKFCKQCNREFKLEYNSQLYCSDNCRQEVRKDFEKKYRKSLKRQIYLNKYRAEHKEEHKLLNLSWNKRNKKYRTEWQRNYCKNINNRLKKNLRKRIWDALKFNYKSITTMKLIGCSIELLKSHLEKQFKSGMSWSNYGKWHVDHIKPCASFDLSKTKEQKICFHYLNLQPMWEEENLSKGSKIK